MTSCLYSQIDLIYQNQQIIKQQLIMQKDFIQMEPTRISFLFPQHTTAKVLLKNITLHQIFIKIISTNPDNYIIQPNQLILEAFDEVTVMIRVKYYQEASLSNYLNNKLIVYNYDLDQEGELWNYQQGIKVENLNKISRLQISINSTANSEGYVIVQPKKKQTILKITKLIGKNFVSFEEKTLIVGFLETLGQFKSIHCINNKIYLAMYAQLEENIAVIKQFQCDGIVSIYSFCRLPIICKNKSSAQAIQAQKLKEMQQILQKMNKQNEIIQYKLPKHLPILIKNHQTETFFIEPQQLNNIKVQSSNSKYKNKSLQFKNDNSPRITNNEGFLQKQINIQQFKLHNIKYNKEKLENKLFISQSNILPNEQKIFKYIQQNQTILNFVMEPIAFTISSSPHSPQKFYILFDSFLQIYQIGEKLQPGKKILIQKIKLKNNYRIIMKQCGHKVVVAFDSNFYVINTYNKSYQIVHVKRKQIYDFTHLSDKKILIMAGRNFSKLSYFGKNAMRSNIKVYSFRDEYNHVHTHQLDDTGDILTIQSMKFFNKDILFVFQKTQKTQLIYFIKVNEFNNFHVLGKIYLEELAIQDIRRFKFSNAGEVYALENIKIGNQTLSFIKKIKIKFWDWKPDIKTECITSIQPQIFSFFDNDEDTLALFCAKKQEITLTDIKQKLNKQFHLSKGFKKLRIKLPFLYIVRDSFIEIIKIA